MHSVLITVDAVRPDHLGQYGYHRDTMPVLDRLLDGGTLYREGYANGPHSGVSIPSFLTSQYRGREALESGPNLATALSEAGVATAGFHSNTMLSNEVDGVAGFDVFEDFGVAEDDNHERLAPSLAGTLFDGLKRIGKPVIGHFETTRWLYENYAPASEQFHFQAYVDAETLTDRALSWLAERGGEDCFLWLHYMDPHRPYGVDPGDPHYVDEPVDDAEIRELMTRAGTEPGAVTAAERERMIDLYDSDLRYTAEHLARLLDGVDDHLGFEETWIGLTADHGEEFGDHGSYFHRNRPYDELLSVPLIVRDPRDDRDSVRKQRELIDLAPTVCGVHDATVPDAFEGTSLDDGSRRRVVATGALNTEQQVAAVRTGAWKYIHVAGGQAELYDLDRDEGEQSDLDDDQESLADSMRDMIPEALLTPEAGVDPGAASGATRERLEQLGYLE